MDEKRDHPPAYDDLDASELIEEAVQLKGNPQLVSVDTSSADSLQVMDVSGSISTPS
jgi:hypothetical protein